MIEEELAELIFFLANTDRLILLNSLNDGKKSRLGDLASILSATPQETSKHLIRLRNEKVVDKDSNGFFFLTEFGKSITKIIRFLLKNRDYFLSYSLSSLPLQFIERIGEIEECEYNSDAFSIFSTFESIVADAKEYVWLMADHPYGGVDVIDSKKMRQGDSNDISWRAVLPYAVGKTIDWKNVNYIKNKKENVEIRPLENIRIPVGLAMNEKLAIFSIANLDGKLELNIGLKGDHPSFHEWLPRSIFILLEYCKENDWVYVV